MFKRFIKGLVIILPCLSVYSVTYAAENLKVKPVYQGIVEVIDEPLSIQFRPFPESIITNKTMSYITVGGTETEMGSNSTGAAQIIRKGNNLEMLISVDEVETLKAGQTEIQKCDIKVVISMSPYGEFRGFDMKSQSIPASELASVKEMLQSIFKQAISTLPKEGIPQGYQFVDKINMGFGDITTIGRVLGKTTFKQRLSLFVDFSGSTMQLDLEGKRVEMAMNGYALMDVATGVWRYNEVSMFLPMPDNAGGSIAVHQQVEIHIEE